MIYFIRRAIIVVIDFWVMVWVHASQEQTLGGKKRPSVMNPLNMFYIVLGTIRGKNKKNWLGNIAFIALY